MHQIGSVNGRSWPSRNHITNQTWTYQAQVHPYLMVSLTHISHIFSDTGGRIGRSL